MDGKSLREGIYHYIKSSVQSQDEFNSLFTSLAALQRSENRLYGRYVESFGSRSISSWRDVIPVPVQFFKEFDLRSYPPGLQSEFCWESSGTTGKKSRTFLADSHTYNLVIEKLWKENVPKFEGNTYRLIPETSEWPHSSLAHFFTIGNSTEVVAEGCFRRWTPAYDSNDELISVFEFHEETETPLRLCGTSYAIASVFDHMEKLNVRFQLPEGSTIMDTGGYKGIVRDRSRDEFLGQAEYNLCIPSKNCLNEYGMSELSSHFWSHWIDGEEWWSVPPWVRVRSVDPFTGEDKNEGVGVFYDLANVWSCCAIQTQDIIEIKEGGGPEYIRPKGRMKEAELKGCSITAELTLSGAE